MADEKAAPEWRTVLYVLWRAFADPGRSFGVKFCRVFLVFEVAGALLDVLAPGSGVAYWSRPHLADIADGVGDLLVWCLALWFVRERDAARAELRQSSQV
jgi:hypothetical protein